MAADQSQDERFHFALEHRSSATHARAGRFTTPHGVVPTPAFMPVGTRGTVKGALPRDLSEAGATMILANTYHLHLRPGEDVIETLGGLHRFMGWDGPILTDSGGYQVFSLGATCRVDDEGVSFRSIVDGAEVRFTPERVIDIQAKLGADVIMAFDHVPPDPTHRRDVIAATDRTHRWLERCATRWRERGGLDSGQALFGIVQGGAFEDLRRASVDAVCAHDFAGYAVGGVSVGEDREAMLLAVGASAPLLPEDKPRYLMGIGTPIDFFDAVERGIDLFDCVTPTRHARTAQAYTSQGRMNLRNQVWRADPRPLDPDCDCPACSRFSRGFLRHLCVTGEMLGPILLTLHNLRAFHRLMAKMRTAIAEDRLSALRAEVIEPMMRRL
ncbi:MAG: tRNA guanosine(34) transglycosylase Tgt [Planctomycetota bacterium]|nr:MAG: tRNA guanosine(34) transglycosylase Tgt [Planctomycetota bacterium]